MESDLEDIIAGLNTAILEKSSEKALPLLKQIATSDPTVCDKLEISDNLLDLLDFNDDEVNVLVAKCIAEIAKFETQRDKYTSTIVIERLINFLSNKSDQIELNIQVCRALGNICYSNDDARNIIKELEGDEIIFNLLDVYSGPGDEIQNQFIRVRCGLISNYLLGSEDIAERAVELNILNKIQVVLEKCTNEVEKHEELLVNLLPPLSILTEQLFDLYFEPELNKLIAKILAGCTDPDLAETCLALMHYQAQNDDVKLLLAEEGLCETIYKLLEKYKTFAKSDESRVLMKLACDLIVIILTGDKSMHFLYTTPLLKYMEEWLDSHDVELLTTGVLALGNFARTDRHCIYMVENKIMHKLLEILSKNNRVDDQMTLQHALLSTLKNIVIPKPNKAAVIEAGLVDIILPMLEIHQPPVVFKLLGTLRMIVDGQEHLALELLQNEKLIIQLVHWSKTSEFTGVLGESLRLMAWLIKHAYQIDKQKDVNLSAVDDSSLKKFVQIDGAIKCMVSMLSSTHLVMQNEGLIALSILATILNRDDQTEINLDELLINAEAGSALANFISLNSEIMSKEIVENLNTLVALLKNSDNLVEHLNQHNIEELLKGIPILVEYCFL